LFVAGEKESQNNNSRRSVNAMHVRIQMY